MSGTTPASTWSATLGQLQLQVTPANFETWLRDTIGLRLEDGGFVVGVQNEFVKEWLQTRLRTLITKTLACVAGHRLDVEFEVIRGEREEPPSLLTVPLPIDNVATDSRRKALPPPVNPAMTFDTFVVGDENRLALKAARNTLVEPGGMNPLVIVGSSGLGKTHLISAIAQEAYEQGLAVIYAPAERFGNEYVRALPGQLDGFRRRYRNADMLLMDDVQFLEGKEKFQEEFFHTFNDLYAKGKQIVIVADRMPAQLEGLSAALRSRMQSGIQADLQKPGFLTRLAILREKAAQQAVRLPDAALELIAQRCCPTVRELEGYLNRVLMYVPLVGGRATPEVIEEALAVLTPTSSSESRTPDADIVVEAVCRRTAVTLADLRGRSRNRDVTYARHLAMYVLREDARTMVAEIGRLFGNRDHSTVLDGVKRIKDELRTRPETVMDLTAVRDAVVESVVAAAQAAQQRDGGASQVG